MANVHLENEEYVKMLLEYIRVLQEGRVKPNTKGGTASTVRESVDNIGDIYIAKCKVNEIFGLNQEKIDKINQTKNIFE